MEGLRRFVESPITVVEWRLGLVKTRELELTVMEGAEKVFPLFLPLSHLTEEG